MSLIFLSALDIYYFVIKHFIFECIGPKFSYGVMSWRECFPCCYVFKHVLRPAMLCYVILRTSGVPPACIVPVKRVACVTLLRPAMLRYTTQNNYDFRCLRYIVYFSLPLLHYPIVCTPVPKKERRLPQGRSQTQGRLNNNTWQFLVALGCILQLIWENLLRLPFPFAFINKYYAFRKNTLSYVILCIFFYILMHLLSPAGISVAYVTLLFFLRSSHCVVVHVTYWELYSNWV